MVDAAQFLEARHVTVVLKPQLLRAVSDFPSLTRLLRLFALAVCR
jgi:hypothetical protein